MAAPTRSAALTLTGSAGTTSFVPSLTTLQTGSAVGDRIFLWVATDGSPTASLGGTSAADGWAILAQQSDATNACSLILLSFTVVTAGTVPDPTITLSASEAVAGFGIRVRPPAGKVLQNILTAAPNQGSSTNPDPSSVTNNTGATQDIYYITAFGGDSNAQATAGPTNYGNYLGTSISSSSQGCCAGIGDRTRTGVAASDVEDPGGFVKSITEQWVAGTIGVYGVTPTDVLAVGNFSTSSPTFNGVTLGGKHLLDTADEVAVGSPTFPVAISGKHLLAVAAFSTAAPSFAPVTVIAKHGLAVGAFSTASPTYGAVLAGKHLLAIANYSVGSPTYAPVTLGTSSPTVALTVPTYSTGSPTYALSSLKQRHNFTAPGFATSSPSFGPTTVTQRHPFTISFSIGSPTFGPVIPIQRHSLAVASYSVGSPGVGSPTISQRHQITFAPFSTGSPTIGSIVVAVKQALGIGNFSVGSLDIGLPILRELDEIEQTLHADREWRVLAPEQENRQLSADYARIEA